MLLNCVSMEAVRQWILKFEDESAREISLYAMNDWVVLLNDTISGESEMNSGDAFQLT